MIPIELINSRTTRLENHRSIYMGEGARVKPEKDQDINIPEKKGWTGHQE